jgi:hypothetical protein
MKIILNLYFLIKQAHDIVTDPIYRSNGFVFLYSYYISMSFLCQLFFEEKLKFNFSVFFSVDLTDD